MHAGVLLAEIRSLSRDFNAPEYACTTYHAFFKGLKEFERDLHGMFISKTTSCFRVRSNLRHPAVRGSVACGLTKLHQEVRAPDSCPHVLCHMICWIERTPCRKAEAISADVRLHICKSC